MIHLPGPELDRNKSTAGKKLLTVYRLGKVLRSRARWFDTNSRTLFGSCCFGRSKGVEVFVSCMRSFPCTLQRSLHLMHSRYHCRYSLSTVDKMKRDSLRDGESKKRRMERVFIFFLSHVSPRACITLSLVAILQWPNSFWRKSTRGCILFYVR